MSSAENERRLRRFPLEIRAARTPDAPALIWAAPFGKGGPRGIRASAPISSLSFAELERLTRRGAHELFARGVTTGERVALLLLPGPAYPVAVLSLLRAGCVAAPLSTRVPGKAVPALLTQLGCRRLITSDAAASPAAAGIEVLDPDMIWSREEQAQFPLIPLPERGKARAELCQRGSDGGTQRPRPHEGKADLPPFDRSAPATIVFTSGSTGVPKAAVHSFDNHWASAVGANRNLPLRPGDRWLLSLPLWHVGGLAVIFRCLQRGAAVAIAGEGEPLADAVLSLRVTHLSLVATQLRRLLGDPRGREALRSLTGVLLGGGPLPAPLLSEAAALGARLVASYGSTEMASQAAATRAGDPPEALRTAGRTLPFREIAIGAGGEILTRGRTLFIGYLEDDGIRGARDPRGWFHTGDLGRLDDAGRLVIEGRRDNMFISGGENIHPEEIERALADFPGMLEALVVPLPDAEFGARPAAFLRTASGELPDPAALGAGLRRTLPGFKVPVRYLAWPRLEEGMKPDRKAFADLAAGEHRPSRQE